MKYFITTTGFKEITETDKRLYEMLNRDCVESEDDEPFSFTAMLAHPYIFFKDPSTPYNQLRHLEPTDHKITRHRGSFMSTKHSDIYHTANCNAEVGQYILVHEIYWYDSGFRLDCTFLAASTIITMLRHYFIDNILVTL